MSKMKIITPTAVTDAMLASSTAPESDYPLWTTGTTYAIGNRRIRPDHHVYERLTAGAGNTVPEGDTANWLDLGYTNRWAMFDRKVGTATVLASPLTVVLRPGSVSGLAMLELVGREAAVTVKDRPGGSVVYSRTIDLDGTVIRGFYDWFFAEFEQRSDFVLTDLPEQYTNAEVTVSLTGTAGGVSCGVLQVGKVNVIGDALSSATVGITNYSVKDTDDFGNIDVVERSYSKRNNLKVLTDRADFNRIYRRLAALRATPCVFVGSEAPGFEPLIVYGFYKDFSIEVAYSTKHLCDIEIEGLI